MNKKLNDTGSFKALQFQSHFVITAFISFQRPMTVSAKLCQEHALGFPLQLTFYMAIHLICMIIHCQSYLSLCCENNVFPCCAWWIASLLFNPNNVTPPNSINAVQGKNKKQPMDLFFWFYAGETNIFLLCSTQIVLGSLLTPLHYINKKNTWRVVVLPIGSPLRVPPCCETANAGFHNRESRALIQRQTPIKQNAMDIYGCSIIMIW